MAVLDLQNLRAYLRSIAPGRIDDTTALEPLLAAAWSELVGGNAEGMSGDKLTNRIKNATWTRPQLTFEIERHGSTVLGSVLADRHEWTVNAETGVADCRKIGSRQVRKPNPPLDISRLVDEVADLIVSGRKDDPRVRWRQDGCARIQAGRVIPSKDVPRLTLEGRRRKFREQMEVRMTAVGWTRSKSVYCRTAKTAFDSVPKADP